MQQIDFDNSNKIYIYILKVTKIFLKRTYTCFLVTKEYKYLLQSSENTFS